MWWAGFIAALLILLVVVLFIRMWMFKSLQKKENDNRKIEIDIDKAANRLAGAVQIPTLSFNEGKEVDRGPFVLLREYLVKQYPNIYQKLSFETIAGDSLLFTWPGSEPALRPILLLAHSDVVPAVQEPGKEWTHAPFSGDKADGFIWGRGTLDDKISAMGILEAVDYLISQGLSPRRSILIAIGHDEEVGGTEGAKNVGKLLSERGIEVEYILDEGGVVVNGMIGNLSVATVGIAEKGYVTLKLSVEGIAGHSSQPPAHT
ncbi:MAG: M20/M25/M40 family metallo-hydrolase, partial [Anaerolineae bacterium]|nr:M20/M25/M40 family metallo-hydrolase [Anaerolineae bacterium]